MTYETILTAAAQLSLPERVRLIGELAATVPGDAANESGHSRLPDILIEAEPFSALDLPRPGPVTILADPASVKRFPEQLCDESAT